MKRRHKDQNAFLFPEMNEDPWWSEPGSVDVFGRPVVSGLTKLELCASHNPDRPSSGKGKPTLLDLFCCAGGAGLGYSRADFEVVGVDVKSQPRYPFTLIQADALTLDPKFIASFDAVHASPPCQS